MKSLTVADHVQQTGRIEQYSTVQYSTVQYSTVGEDRVVGKSKLGQHEAVEWSGVEGWHTNPLLIDRDSEWVANNRIE